MRRLARRGFSAYSAPPPWRLRRPMRSTILALAVCRCSAAALAAPAARRAERFPPAADRPQQQPPPDRQGPVAPDVPASRRARADARRRPPAAPSARADACAAADRGAGGLAGASPRPTPDAPAARPPRAGRGTDAAPRRGRRARRGPPAAPASDAAAAPRRSATVAAAPATAPRRRTKPARSWLWLLGGLPLRSARSALAGWAGAPPGPAAAVPVGGAADRAAARSAPVARAAPRPGPRSAPAEPLQVTLEPLRLSLTLMNATLAYRLELANRGAAPLTASRIGADMISAHASMTPRAAARPAPAAGAATVQRIERLEPGESRVVEGEFRLPFPQIVPIRQGNAALLLPLARFRVEAEGAAPVVRTFVVGQPGQRHAACSRSGSTRARGSIPRWPSAPSLDAFAAAAHYRALTRYRAHGRPGLHRLAGGAARRAGPRGDRRLGAPARCRARCRAPNSRPRTSPARGSSISTRLKDLDSPVPAALPTAEQFAARMAETRRQRRRPGGDLRRQRGEDLGAGVVHLPDARDRSRSRSSTAGSASGAPRAARSKAAQRHGAPARSRPRAGPGTVRSKADMLANVASGAEQVLDARGAGRFTGAEPETAARHAERPHPRLAQPAVRAAAQRPTAPSRTRPACAPPSPRPASTSTSRS